MLPNLSRTVKRFSQPLILKSITQSIVNHRPVNTETVSNFRGMIISASPEMLKAVEVDISLSYYMCITDIDIGVNDRIEYKGKSFRIIQEKDSSDYGFNKYLLEEDK